MLSLSGRLECRIGSSRYEEREVENNIVPLSDKEMIDVEETKRVLNTFVDMVDVLEMNYSDIMNIFYKISVVSILESLYGDSFTYSKALDMIDTFKQNNKIKQMRASYIYQARQERAK